jgi:hypothetical protein
MRNQLCKSSFDCNISSISDQHAVVEAATRAKQKATYAALETAYNKLDGLRVDFARVDGEIKELTKVRCLFVIYIVIVICFFDYTHDMHIIYSLSVY